MQTRHLRLLPISPASAFPQRIGARLYGSSAVAPLRAIWPGNTSRGHCLTPYSAEQHSASALACGCAPRVGGCALFAAVPVACGYACGGNDSSCQRRAAGGAAKHDETRAVALHLFCLLLHVCASPLFALPPMLFATPSRLLLPFAARVERRTADGVCHAAYHRTHTVAFSAFCLAAFAACS